MQRTSRNLARALAALVLGAGTAALCASAGSRAETASPGQALAFDRAKGNCLACHTIKGGDVPSNVGPELSDMKTRFRDRQVLYQILYDEEQRNSQTVMPPFGKNLILTQQEINEIIDFLYTL